MTWVVDTCVVIDLERDGGGFLRGLERESAVQASSAPGEASSIPKCAAGVLYSVIGVRSRNAPTQCNRGDKE